MTGDGVVSVPREAAEAAQGAVMRWMNSSTDVRRHVGTEVVAAIEAAGFVVIQLPDREGFEDYGLSVGAGALPIAEMVDGERTTFRSVAETRRYAAALLAAAAEASDVVS